MVRRSSFKDILSIVQVKQLTHYSVLIALLVLEPFISLVLMQATRIFFLFLITNKSNT